MTIISDNEPPKKPQKTKRTKSIKFRVTPQEYEELMSKKTRVELAVWVREICLNIDIPEPKHQKFSKVDPKLLYQINRIGNNLNQLTKQVNTQPATLQTVQALAVLSQIQADINEIKLLLSAVE